jgi:hypothetical protein
MDTMMMLLLLYLMIGPSGAALSFDAWWQRYKARRAGLPPPRPEPSVSANFAIRLIQVNFCFIYLGSGTSKLLGPSWWNGTALWGVMANYSFNPLRVGPYYDFLVFLSQHRWLWEICMAGGCLFTLVVEIGFPFLVWRKSLRWIMVGCSILLHTGIGLIMGLTPFSLFMLAMVMSFVPSEAVEQLVGNLRAVGRRLIAAGPPAPKPAARQDKLVAAR